MTFISKPFKNFLLNAITILSSLLMTLLILEFVVFRYILIPTELPEIVYKNGIVKYEPNTSGIFRKKSEIQSHWHINSSGYNSDQNFTIARNNKQRAIVIGDSYVEALMVDSNNSLSEQAQRRLGAGYEIYRMGISGAPLSQYLYILENEALNYNPDMVVMILVHNDFDESFRFKNGHYQSSFMKLDLSNEIKEIAPAPYTPSRLDLVRKSTTFRYLYYTQNIDPRAIFAPKQNYQNNINEDELIKQKTQIEKATRYLFERISNVCRSRGIKLLMIMDASRANIYNGTNNISFLNQIAQETNEALNIDFIDLTSAFRTDYERNKKRFEFASDWHWNEYGHKIAGNIIADWIAKQ